MKTRNKKTLIYAVSLLYIALSIVLMHFGNFTIKNGILSFIVICGVLPATIISTIFGFFGGILGEIIGTLITIILTIFIIDRFFRKQKKTEHK